jgi:hypothetical protein
MEVARFCSKLVAFQLSVINTSLYKVIAWTNTVSYYRIRKLRILNVFKVQSQGVNVIKLLPPLHGNTIILCYKAILPWQLSWNGGELPWYFKPGKSRVKITKVIYRGIVL